MTKSLVIIFVKNLKLGQVKTRLAKTIGDYAAYEVYSELVSLTEDVTSQLSTDRHIYYSSAIDKNLWPEDYKAVQNGDDLGKRMLNAFKEGFKSGYERILLIGSDLPDLTREIIAEGFKSLDHNDAVFGPALDGGYYLIGLNRLIPEIFMNKSWSTSKLLAETLQELKQLKCSFDTLTSLNDIDTYEDLISSTFYRSNQRLQQKIQQFND